MDVEVVFVIGGPGSGKGTICQEAVNELGFKHLSAGDLLRAERKVANSPLKAKIDVIDQGQLVEDWVTVQLLLNAIKKGGKGTYLIDGFPRSLENQRVWKEMAKVPVIACLYFECSDASMKARILRRNLTEQRSDGQESIIAERLKVHHATSGPVVDFYRQQKMLKIIDANGTAPEVWKLAKSFLKTDLRNQAVYEGAS